MRQQTNTERKQSGEELHWSGSQKVQINASGEISVNVLRVKANFKGLAGFLNTKSSFSYSALSSSIGIRKPVREAATMVWKL